MSELPPRKYDTLPKPIPVNDIPSLRLGDPPLYAAWQDMLGAMKESMLPMDAMLQLVEAMPASVQRDIVNKIAGFDSSVLMTLKGQMQLVDQVLRRVISEDGKLQETAKEIGITPKEAINMSIKLTQVITRDLPKMFKVERLQNLEAALFEVIETQLNREQQDAVLLKLQEKSLEEARRKEL